MTVDAAARLDHAVQLSRSAGAILMEYYGRLTGFGQKRNRQDLVTAADLASEKHLVEAIAQAFPDDGILAEEGSSKESVSGWQWILDPLDGTTNFVHAFPYFMVSIGLSYRGERTLAVCYGPVYDELFAAQLGRGATKNGERISVSDTDLLSGALVATGFPYNRSEFVDELLAPLGRALRTTHGVRRCGAAVYDQCHLAQGSLDVFYERNLSPWDLAAGTLIVEEAGGLVTGFQGAFDLYGKDVLISNGKLHAEFRQAVLCGPACDPA